MKEKEVIGEKEHHTSKGKKPRHGLVMLLVAVVLLGLMVLPVILQETKIKVPESIPAIKPSPPVEPEIIVEEEVIEEEEEIEKPAAPVSLKKRITIKRYSLEPDVIEIEEGTVVSWVNSDDRRHKIVCYINSRRIFAGETLYEGELSKYNFRDSGEYMCLDAVFGSRMTVIVEPMSLSRITGGTIGDIPTENIVLTGILLFVILTAISIYLYANRII